MSRHRALICIAGFVVGLGLGCGAPKPPEMPGGGDPPKPADDQSQARAELAELEKQIAAKDQELTELRRRADGLRAKLGGENVLTDLQKLIDGIPTESAPRADKRGEVKREAANQWLKKHATGKPLEIRGNLTGVSLSPMDGKFGVTVCLGKLGSPTPNIGFGWGLLGAVRAGGDEWSVYMSATYTGPPDYVDPATASRIRDLEGKPVRFIGKLKQVEFIGEEKKLFLVHGPPDSIPFLLLRFEDDFSVVGVNN